MRTAGINLLCAAGVGALGYGLYLAWEPLAWVAGGGVAVALAVTAYRKGEE